MKNKVKVLVGTSKGGFIFESNATRCQVASQRHSIQKLECDAHANG